VTTLIAGLALLIFGSDLCAGLPSCIVSDHDVDVQRGVRLTRAGRACLWRPQETREDLDRTGVEADGDRGVEDMNLEANEHGFPLARE
jgi:hypothetical protein